MKVAVSIPDDVFAETELLAKRLEASRREVHGRALGEFLANDVCLFRVWRAVHFPELCKAQLTRELLEAGVVAERPHLRLPELVAEPGGDLEHTRTLEFLQHAPGDRVGEVEIPKQRGPNQQRAWVSDRVEYPRHRVECQSTQVPACCLRVRTIHGALKHALNQLPYQPRIWFARESSRGVQCGLRVVTGSPCHLGPDEGKRQCVARKPKARRQLDKAQRL